LNSLTAFCTVSLVALQFAGSVTFGQTADAARIRELREKARNSALTPAEKTELDAAMKARTGGGAATPSRPPAAPNPAQPRDAATREQRLAEYAERQEFTLERMRQMGIDALAAAAGRQAPAGPARAFFVNNESGSDQASGLSPDQAVRSMAQGVSLLRPGDTLHLAVTGQPYRETLHLGDGFGGAPGKPIVIEGHGATLTGCDPLRLDGWAAAGAPGLYRSAKFLCELEEFGDPAKLMRVFLLFDGVMQRMGRSSKGAKARFKAPTELKPGEWTYVEAEKLFYIKVSGQLADAKIEAPYRRNGVAVRSPKIAATHVVIKDLIVCHVLNDGFNLHGATKDFLLQNIAAYECGDDGVSPHETCEVTIDGYWGVGNSTGMGNGNLSVTKASNVRLEGNTAHQFMTGHAPITELRNALIIAAPGTQPINVTNAQDTRLKLDNVQIVSPPNQKVLNVVNSQIDARRITAVGPAWENAGTIRVTESVIGGSSVTNLPDGSWKGERNVYAIAFDASAQNHRCLTMKFGKEILDAGSPFPNAGANAAEFKIPPRPVPHPASGKFTSLSSASPAK
jgi:hypothetical protein